MIFLSLFALASSNLHNDFDAIAKVIHQFTQGADQNDVKTQGAVLHQDFRVVWNDTNEDLIKVLDRTTYLSLIESKKFGGGKRQVEIISLDFFEASTAKAKVKLSEEGKPTFYSYYSLVKTGGKWMIVEDLVVMK